MRPIIAQVKDGQMEMTELSKAQLRDWMKLNPGKKIRIVPEEPASYNVRKFFEGPITQYFFYQHKKGIFKNFKDAREALKLELNPIWIVDIHGNRQMQGGSTQGKKKDWWDVFIDKAQDLFMTCGYEFPNSEDYKKWIASAPLIDEVYPPLQRLIEAYNLSPDGN